MSRKHAYCVTATVNSGLQINVYFIAEACCGMPEIFQKYTNQYIPTLENETFIHEQVIKTSFVLLVHQFCNASVKSTFFPLGS